MTTTLNPITKKSKKRKSQVAGESKVLRWFGKYSIEYAGGNLVICDGILTNWLICYGNGTWAGDMGLGTHRKDIVRYLNRICDQYA